MAKRKIDQETVQLNGKTITIGSGPVGVYRTAGSIAFDVLNYFIIGLAAFTTVMPIIYIICNTRINFFLQTFNDPIRFPISIFVLVNIIVNRINTFPGMNVETDNLFSLSYWFKVCDALI